MFRLVYWEFASEEVLEIFFFSFFFLVKKFFLLKDIQ
jgi:hypothetical protein